MSAISGFRLPKRIKIVLDNSYLSSSRNCLVFLQGEGLACLGLGWVADAALSRNGKAVVVLPVVAAEAAAAAASSDQVQCDRCTLSPHFTDSKLIDWILSSHFTDSKLIDWILLPHFTDSKLIDWILSPRFTDSKVIDRILSPCFTDSIEAYRCFSLWLTLTQ